MLAFQQLKLFKMKRLCVVTFTFVLFLLGRYFSQETLKSMAVYSNITIDILISTLPHCHKKKINC